MLEEASHTGWAGSPWAVPIFATFGALLSVAYFFASWAMCSSGAVRDDYPHTPHDPSFGLWARRRCWRFWWC